MHPKTFLVAVAVTACLLLPGNAQEEQRKEQAPPPLLRDLLEAQQTDAAIPRSCATAAAGWDAYFLEPSVFNGRKDARPMRSSTGSCDAILTTYQMKDWNVATTQTLAVWLATVSSRNPGTPLSPEEVLAQVLNSDRAAKDFIESARWNVENLQATLRNLPANAKAENLDAAQLKERTEAIQAQLARAKNEAVRANAAAAVATERKFTLQPAGKFEGWGDGRFAVQNTVYRIDGMESFENHFFSSLRIVRIKEGYLLWSLKLSGAPHQLDTSYSFDTNKDWFAIGRRQDAKPGKTNERPPQP